MINFYHRKNETSIDVSSIQKVRAIQIDYSGKIYAESQLENSWTTGLSSRRIICVDKGDSKPELLFNYVGFMRINSVIVIDQNNEIHTANIVIEDEDYFERQTVDFDKNTQYWEQLDNYHQSDHRIVHSSLVKNNLQTEQGEYYFLDGTPYNGEYHLHGDFQAMTGGVHTDESIHIYMKDGRGNIVDFRRNDHREIAMQAINKYKAIIPSIRKFRKSYAAKNLEQKKIGQPASQKNSSSALHSSNVKAPKKQRY